MLHTSSCRLNGHHFSGELSQEVVEKGTKERLASSKLLTRPFFKKKPLKGEEEDGSF